MHIYMHIYMYLYICIHVHVHTYIYRGWGVGSVCLCVYMTTCWRVDQEFLGRQNCLCVFSAPSYIFNSYYKHIFLICIPPVPMNHVKIFKGWSPRDAPSKLVQLWYKSFPPDQRGLVAMKPPTRLSNKTSNASSCAEDQILENKNLRNMILNICTGR